MPNVLITDKGMDFVSSANDNGIYIDLRYFIPVYDDRIDSSVRNSPVLSSFSDIADKTITEPYGEKLWKRKHTLGDASTFLISAVDFNSSKLTNTYQKSSVVTNLYDGTPLSNQVSATSWSATGGESLWTWEAIAGGQGIEGDDSQPGTGADGFGTTVGYYPTYDGPDEDRLRGSFKFQIDSNWGNIKFNKIAMYAVAVDANGDDVPNSIGYFGEAYLSNVAVRSDIGVGYDLFEADVQIDLSGVSADWNDVFYSSSADYWSHSPGGLYYPGRIGVGVFEDGQKEISATMHIRRERKDGEIDDDIPQLRIDQDDNKYWTIEVVSDAHDIRSGEVDGGDMVINPGWEEYTGDALAIKPFIDSSISLGTEDNSFRELWLWNYSGLDDIITLNVENFSENYAAQFNGNQVLIGKSDGESGDDKFALRLDDLGVEITSGNDLYGAFKGGDIVRDSENLLIYNTTSGDDEVENIYLFAGLKLDYGFSITDGQTGATHKNIMNEIDQYGLISIGDDDRLAPEAELHIAARGQIGLHGPVEIQSLVENDDGDENNAIILSRESQNLMFIGAGVNSDVSHETIADRMGSGIFPEMSDLVDGSSVLYLVSNDIRVEADTIMPLQDGRTLLGTPGYKFKNLYIEEIDVENALIEEAFFNTLRASSISAGFSSELDITAEDKISLRGPIEIQSLIENEEGDKNNAIILSRDPQNRMFIGAGVKSDVSYEDIVEKMGEGLPDPMDDLIDGISDLFLVASIVRFESLVITPIQNGVTNLGTPSVNFKNLYIEDIYSSTVRSTSGFYESNRNYTLGEWVDGTSEDVYSNATESSEIVDLYSDGDSLGISNGDDIYINVVDEFFNQTTKILSVNEDTDIQDLLDEFNQFVSINAGFYNGKIKVVRTNPSVNSIECLLNDSITIGEFVNGNFGPDNEIESETLQIELQNVDQSFTKVGKTAFIRGAIEFEGGTGTTLLITLPEELKRRTFTGSLGYFQGSVFPASNLSATSDFVIYPSSESDGEDLLIKPTEGNSFDNGETYYYNVSYECLN